jgi:hypothetical protein
MSPDQPWVVVSRLEFVEGRDQPGDGGEVMDPQQDMSGEWITSRGLSE